MRSFIPNDGLFELTFPLDWKYQLQDGYIHQFHFNEGIGSLHFSVLGDEARKTFNKISKNPKALRKKWGNVTAYETPLAEHDKFNVMLWHVKISVHYKNYYFLASYTYSVPHKDSEPFKRELQAIYDIIASLKIIQETDRHQRVTWHKFGKFLQGLAASEELFTRASKNGCFIECVCLLANQIDAMLRTANILFNQIENKDKTIDLTLVYQGETDKPIFEKQIYQLSKDRGIIDQATYDELYKVYDERNRVVHRYIISDITTMDVLSIALKYSQLRAKIYEVVDQLEKEQIDLGLGITGISMDLDKDTIIQANEIFIREIKEKHGGIDFEQADKDRHDET